MTVRVTDLAQVNQPLLFEMIRSFTTLARTLNLSHAVEELNSTRQTVRRHIAQLEELRGERLFDVINRRYELTEAGNAALPSALSLLGHGRLWLRGQIKDVDGLMGMSYEEGSEWYYHQQQQPINVAWSNKSPLLRAAIQCWAETEGALEHPKMMQVRPYALIYRDTAAGWICIEVGEQSFYSKWWGWANARSSVGRSLNQFPFGPELARVMDVPLREVQTTRGMRIDQVVTKVPRTVGGQPEHLAFERLLLGCQMPDDSFALMVVVDRPDMIRVKGLTQSALEEMSDDIFVDFSKN